MRVAAVDCGTNSIRLLVADVDDVEGGSDGGPARAREVTRRMEIVRLGQGLDRTGAIAPEALDRTLGVAREYARTCDELGARRVRFVATSASRDARNAADFVAGVRDAFAPRDVVPEVVTGLEEADLSFRGATGDLLAAGVPGPYLVVDLGGGSTEFVRGDAGAGEAAAACSLDVGCVRLHERHLASLAPGAEGPEAEAARAALIADVDAALDEAERRVGFAGLGALVGLAGTVTTVTAHALGLPAYERDRIHLADLPVADVVAACDDLAAGSRARLESLPYLHPGRVDVIGAGALAWGRIVARVAAASGLPRVLASEHDILDGIAESAARTA